MASNPNAKIEKFLPEHFIQVFGKNLPAIREALNHSFEETEQLIQACIDNLFLTTASGRYLIQLGEEQGFIMPQNSGLDIRAYKALVPIMVSSPKQVRISIQELIKVFYNAERVRPSTTSAILGPYSISPGDNIILETESGQVEITFVAGQFSDFSNVTATELAAVINYSQEIVVADSVLDRATNQEYLRVSSKTFGPAAYIKVTGGTLQNVVKFPFTVDTDLQAGTTWTLEKDFTYTDLLKFTWDGVGTNPNIYLANTGDYITIRGLVDGVEQFSLLNGSYQLVDVGYDYFVIRNTAFQALSSTYSQLDADELVFTKDQKSILFDQAEYAYVTEDENQTITVTVPAVPPLARRFLKGSAHLRGSTYQVLDFTRNTIQVEVPATGERPPADNTFSFYSDKIRPDFRKLYSTVTENGNLTQPTYNLISGDDNEFSLFPYTVPTSIGTDGIFGDIGSDIFVLDFPITHGLRHGWSFTLGYVGGNVGNLTTADIASEHQVSSIVDNSQIQFKIKDSLGFPIAFSGIEWGTLSLPEVWQHVSAQLDEADFYLEFASALDATNSGLEVGMKFQIDPTGGIIVDTTLSSQLRYRDLEVTSISSNIVNFKAGIGIGSTGMVIQDIFGVRSGWFGGALTYFFDKTSSSNLEIMSGMSAAFTARAEPVNENYVGGFVYDQQGATSFVTVSQFVSGLSQTILKGENLASIIVDTLDSALGVEMPKTGLIVLEYGTERFEGPIRYFSTIKNLAQNQILIDPAYKFKKSHSAGAQVQMIHEARAYRPTSDGADYPVYLTGTVEARNTLFRLIELLVAAGIFVIENVIKPDLLYDDPAIPVFD